MYKKPNYGNTSIKRNVSKEGEPMHEKIERLTNNAEITNGRITKLSPNDTKSLIYTDKKAGVVPQTDIRTDKWENAAMASSKLAHDYVDGRGKQNVKTKIDKVEPTDGKGETPTVKASE